MINYLEQLLKAVNIDIDHSVMNDTTTLDLSNMDKSKYVMVAIPYDRCKLAEDTLNVYMFNATIELPLGNIISLYAKHFIVLLSQDYEPNNYVVIKCFNVKQDKLVIGEFYKIGSAK